MKRGLRLFGAFFIMALGVAFVVGFEFYGKDKIDSIEVVVAKETIGFKELITADNIEVVNVRRGTEVDNHLSPLKYEALIGKHASIKIEKGAQLYHDLIDTYDLVPDSSKGEFVAPIPKDWLFAVPGSLRRTYVADVYVIADKDQIAMQNLLREEENDSDDDKDESDKKVIRTDIKPDNLPILENVRVASVKDSGNKEVIESEETNEATGQVAELEIIADESMLETIKEHTAEGYKLYVVYKFERGSVQDE